MEDNHCQDCGWETMPLDDEQQCPVCTARYTVTTGEAIRERLRLIANVVRESVVYEDVHPDDIAEEVLSVLREPAVTEWLSKRERWRDVSARGEAQLDELRKAAAVA